MSGRGARALTTHALDTARGRPTAGLRLELAVIEPDGRARLLKAVSTNAEGHITPEVQAAMAKPPHFVIPTNRKVVLAGAIVEKVARTPDELTKLVFHDWAKINEVRAAAIERFNREIKL